MRRHLLTAAGLGGLALLMAGEALAWSSNGQRWSAEQMPVRYHVNNQLSTDVPDAEALAAVQEGFNVWTEAPCASMSWDFAGRTDSTAWAESDGMNTVSWREQNWDQGGSVLAITSVFWNFQEVINDTDIKFNGVNHTWGALDGPGGRATDIASVSAHEVGHALGLGHSDVPGSTMWPSTGPGDISVRSLGRDDLEGACEIYPNGGEVPDPGNDGGGGPGNGQLGDDCSATACAAGTRNSSRRWPELSCSSTITSTGPSSPRT